MMDHTPQAERMVENEGATPLPLPPNFPVVWEGPEEARWLWMNDRMHFPGQLTTMDTELIQAMYAHGAAYAAERYHLPVHPHARTINSYHYMAIAPLPGSPEELAELGRQSEELLGAAVGRLWQLWQDEILAETRQHLEFWESFDLAGAEMPALLMHLDETETRLQRVWQLHFTLAFPMLLAAGLFDDTYRELLGGDGVGAHTFDSWELLQGFDNWSLRSDREIWRLSRRALASPEARQVLETEAAADVVPALEATEAGRAFLEDLRAYLSAFGHRAELWRLSRPSMIEDPTPVIKTLKDYVTQPEADLDAALIAAADQRESRLAEVRETLRDYPRPAVEQFEHLLKAAQDSAVLSEDHNYWIDFRTTYRVRLVLLELGRRLADAGTIDAPDDVMHLTFAELRDSGAHLGDPAARRQALVAERKAEIARFAAVQAPPAVGSQSPGPPPNDPLGRALGKFFGAPPRPSEQPNILNGAPGSPGVARGTARIVRSLAEAAKLRPGDILVAETTAPPWTALFGTAAAIVTDTGGILSHCALVAREYGIPAVVGVGMATGVIQDGQMIEVDGNAGVVRLL